MALRKIMLKTIIGLMAFIFCNVFNYGTTYAAEAISPMQPGASTGNAAGLLPPDGWYFSTDFDYETGYVKNGSGGTAITPGGQKIKASNSAEAALLLWVPGWEFLGARYAMAIVQPYKFQRTTNSGNGNNSVATGNNIVNTTLTPLLLSWDLGDGFNLGTGLSIVLPDGKFDYSYNADTGLNTRSSTAIGNHFWTFEPNIALTYLHDDWAFTLNNILDFNTTDHTTDYETGKIYYLDATAAKKIGKFTVGVIGNYMRQISDDKIDGQALAAVDGVNSEGNRIQYLSLGPLLGYNFGPFSVTARALLPLHTQNDCACSFYHIGITVPF